MPIKTIENWRQHIADHWPTLRQEVRDLKFKTVYEDLLAITLSPVLPRNKTGLNALVKILNNERHGQPLAEMFTEIYKKAPYTVTVKMIVEKRLTPAKLTVAQQEAFDWVMARVGVVPALMQNDADSTEIIRQLRQSLDTRGGVASAISVQLRTMNAGENAIVAVGDARVIINQYQGSKSALKSYLSAIRSEWNLSEFDGAMQRYSQHIGGGMRLHHLYTPVDVWNDPELEQFDVEKLTERRFKAIEHDLTDARRPALEAIALEPLLVITGGPGTGKSALLRFIATCLAYASDPSAEKKEQVKGLDLLGPAWIHDAMLPLFVNLRNFCADKSVFPDSPEKGTAESLLTYLKKTTGSFGTEIEDYLTDDETDAPYTTLLFLDGLDEVYSERDRIILQSIIENWATRFSKCRVLVTSRTYAYRRDAKWRLSQRFASVELAPYTALQMQSYIENWYSQAAILRPALFGGRDVAEDQTQRMAQDLIDQIKTNRELWPLARLPLMLAMLTLVHESNRKLPLLKAGLYDMTVDLLNRPKSSTKDALSQQMANINMDSVLSALMLIAFDLQTKQSQLQQYPATIRRADLIDRLIQQNKKRPLGASVETIADYLGTRNGILVSDANDLYRFPHLSIQEYLAARALIQVHNACPMPEHLKPMNREWVFPDNIAALLKDEPYRWRNVTLFAGSIIATGPIQHHRWLLIESLLPVGQLTASLTDEQVSAIYIAGEIWAEDHLDWMLNSQHQSGNNLLKALTHIQYDERLDAPDRERIVQIIAELKRSLMP